MEPAEKSSKSQKVDLSTIRVQVEKFWDENLKDFLSSSHGIEITRLLNVFKDFKSGKITADELIFEAKFVIDRTWELLNVGKWMDVPVEKKQVYAIASFVKIVGLLNTQQESNVIEKALEVTDLGILLGFPIGSVSLTQVADLLSQYVEKDVPDEATEIAERLPDSLKKTDEGCPTSKGKVQWEPNVKTCIDAVDRPSLEHFYREYLNQKRPVKLLNCMRDWPALKLWPDFDYIVKKAGCRTVPIELGKNYADEDYSQKLMKISDFVRDFMRSNSGQIGYLAQHQLFDQVPELKRDIIEPDYCALSQNPDSEAVTEINAWFGPAGTVSPLHFDPKNNLLCQVVGTKKVILHPPSDTPYLYPHEGSLLFNTSRVDVENPDLKAFPRYEKAVRTECLLTPGDMLFIPPKHWHYVKSLENSFSVSFWWE